MFADDLLLQKIICCLEDSLALQKDVDLLTSWINEHKLTLMQCPQVQILVLYYHKKSRISQWIDNRDLQTGLGKGSVLQVLIGSDNQLQFDLELPSLQSLFQGKEIAGSIMSTIL